MVHLGIIPDGNRRWCVENNIDKNDLVKVWTIKLKNLLIEISKIKKSNLKYLQKVNELSFYVCSIDNINRDDKTKELIYRFIKNIKIIFDNKELYIEKKNIDKVDILIKCINWKINFIGDIELLSDEMKTLINEIKINNEKEKNPEYKIFTINLAIAYDYNKDLLNYGNNNLINYNRVQSDIDILFRSGKEKRISGFFPTKINYSELFFIDKYWPDVTLKVLNNTVKKFYERNRRFGK
jgi:undecaprenyl diphosphate synthase